MMPSSAPMANTSGRKKARAFFSARVTYRSDRGKAKSMRLVGIDEARFEPSEISWISPIAKALLRAAVGDAVEVRMPKGIEPLEILERPAFK
jgi:transcription elongation factor GreB